MLNKIDYCNNKRKGLGREDLMHQCFARDVRTYEIYNKLKCLFWSYDPGGEKRTEKTGSLIKSKGHNRGKPDYWFRVLRGDITHNLFLEFKTETGRLEKEQKIFRESCQHSFNDHYYVVRSVEEGINILKKHNVI